MENLIVRNCWSLEVLAVVMDVTQVRSTSDKHQDLILMGSQRPQTLPAPYQALGSAPKAAPANTHEKVIL